MATIDLVCNECKHAFAVVTRVAIKPRQKRCTLVDNSRTFGSN